MGFLFHVPPTAITDCSVGTPCGESMTVTIRCLVAVEYHKTNAALRPSLVSLQTRCFPLWSSLLLPAGEDTPGTGMSTSCYLFFSLPTLSLLPQLLVPAVNYLSIFLSPRKLVADEKGGEPHSPPRATLRTLSQPHPCYCLEVEFHKTP